MTAPAIAVHSLRTNDMKPRPAAPDSPPGDPSRGIVVGDELARGSRHHALPVNANGLRSRRGPASLPSMGYECLYRFYCKSEMAARLRAGLGSLLIVEAGRTEAILGDGSAVALKREWPAAQPPPAAYALVPLGDAHVRESWFFHFEDGDNDHGSPAFDYIPPWARGTPLEWFAVAASLDEEAGQEHTVFTVRPSFKDMAVILSQEVVRRFYRRMAFGSGALLGYFSDDYSDALLSADVVLSREMHGSSRDLGQIDRFVATALQTLSVARNW